MEFLLSAEKCKKECRSKEILNEQGERYTIENIEYRKIYNRKKENGCFWNIHAFEETLH